MSHKKDKDSRSVIMEVAQGIAYVLVLAFSVMTFNSLFLTLETLLQAIRNYTS